jgi:hypothetical protein
MWHRKKIDDQCGTEMTHFEWVLTMSTTITTTLLNYSSIRIEIRAICAQS